MRTLLIDGDIFIYQIASALEVSTDWGDGQWTLTADENEGRRRLADRFDAIAEVLKADQIVIAVKDSENWRKKVLPSYKANRINIREPLIRKALMAYCHEKYKVYQRPTLEGDDVIGILATAQAIKGEKIMVSPDKDMRSIPGLLYNPDKPEQGIVEVSEADADYFHMYQTLVGDRTDNYGGCPGIGPKKAESILAAANSCALESDGPTRTQAYWFAIKAAYAKAGLSEEVALTMARVARICRASDYDFKRKEVILWKPPTP